MENQDEVERKDQVDDKQGSAEGEDERDDVLDGDAEDADGNDGDVSRQRP